MAASSPPAHSVVWKDVSATIVQKRGAAPRQILHDSYGAVQAGSAEDNKGLLALMGASGSGKTTLLTILAAHEPCASGDVRLDGVPYDGSTGAKIGFVPQADRLFSTLTVGETLRFAAKLRGGASEAQVGRLLQELELTHVEHTRVGDPEAIKRQGVSGGERKRCAVGVELVHSPPLLILDEPTSGLDSRTAANLMASLARLAAQQAVICSLHQPSARAFAHVSRLLLLSAGGHTAYYGAAPAAVAHFASVGAPVPQFTNPAEHYLDVLGEADAPPIAKLMAAAADAKAALDGTPDAPPPPADAASAAAASAAAPPLLDQVRALWWRSNTHNTRNPAFLRAMGSRSITMALVIGYLFCGLGNSQRSVQDRTGVLYFVLVNQIMSATASLRTFIAERAIIAHEQRGSMYSLMAYFVARSVAESYLQLIFAMLFGGGAYALVGLAPTLHQLLTFLAVVALVTLCAESYVVFVGALMPDDRSAAVVTPLFLALFMVTGGFFVNGQSVPLLFRAFNHVNMFCYGFAALLTNEMQGLTFTCEPSELVGGLPDDGTVLSKSCAAAMPPPRCPVTSGEHVIERMALGELTIGQNAAAIGCLAIGYRLLTYRALARRFRSPVFRPPA